MPVYVAFFSCSTVGAAGADCPAATVTANIAAIKVMTVSPKMENANSTRSIVTLGMRGCRFDGPDVRRSVALENPTIGT